MVVSICNASPGDPFSITQAVTGPPPPPQDMYPLDILKSGGYIICPRGYTVVWGKVLGGKCLGGKCPGGKCPGVYVIGVSVRGYMSGCVMS